MSTREFCSVCGELYEEIILDPKDIAHLSPLFSSLQKRSVCASCCTLAEEKVWKRFTGLDFHTYDYAASLYSELDKMGA